MIKAVNVVLSLGNPCREEVECIAHVEFDEGCPGSRDCPEEPPSATVTGLMIPIYSEADDRWTLVYSDFPLNMPELEAQIIEQACTPEDDVDEMGMAKAYHEEHGHKPPMLSANKRSK